VSLLSAIPQWFSSSQVCTVKLVEYGGSAPRVRNFASEVRSGRVTRLSSLSCTLWQCLEALCIVLMRLCSVESGLINPIIGIIWIVSFAALSNSRANKYTTAILAQSLVRFLSRSLTYLRLICLRGLCLR